MIRLTGKQHQVVGIGFGVAAAYAIVHGQGEQLGAITAVGSAIGCWLPDMDHDMTKIGRKRKLLTNVSTNIANIIVFGGIVGIAILAFLMFTGFVDYGIDTTQLLIAGIVLIGVAIGKKVIGNSKTFKWATKHRGLMHTLVIPAAFLFALNVSDYPLYFYTILGLTIGYCSHLFADMLTVEGCPILFPITRNNIRFLRLRTKNKSCTYAAYIVALGAVLISYILF